MRPRSTNARGGTGVPPGPKASRDEFDCGVVRRILVSRQACDFSGSHDRRQTGHMVHGTRKKRVGQTSARRRSGFRHRLLSDDVSTPIAAFFFCRPSENSCSAIGISQLPAWHIFRTRDRKAGGNRHGHARLGVSTTYGTTPRRLRQFPAQRVGIPQLGDRRRRTGPERHGRLRGEAGRYHLYVSYAFPRRTAPIIRRQKKLEDLIRLGRDPLIWRRAGNSRTATAAPSPPFRREDSRGLNVNADPTYTAA